MTDYTVTISPTASVLRRQDFESHVTTHEGFDRGHLAAIWETYGAEPLVLVEVDSGFCVIGHLHGVSSTPGYGNATLGITGLYEGAEKSPTYYRGYQIRQVTTLTGSGSERFRVLDTYRNWKRAAIDAVRATLPQAEAWAGKWEATIENSHRASVSREAQGAPIHRARDWWAVVDGTVHVQSYSPITEEN